MTSRAPDPGPPPRRVTVTHPLTAAAHRQAGGAPGRGPHTTGWRPRHDLDEQTEVGVLLVRSLVRAQLRLALRLTAVFAFLLGGLPLLFAVVPGSRSARLAGLPLPWLVLGLLVYPVFVAGGWLYVRLAERNERDFVDLLDHP